MTTFLNPIKNFLEQMNEIRSTGAGVDETSYYGPLQQLLNHIGKTLNPEVRCVMQLRNVGAGHPDGGLFPANQQSNLWLENPDTAPLPERGAIEVKPPSADILQTAQSTQVLDYLKRYGLVLVTNYRHFLLVKADAKGQPERLGEYVLAPSEIAFWAMTAHPGTKEIKEKAKELTEFLKRVMFERAPLYRPEDVAWFLAFYAKEALNRVAGKAELPELSNIKEAMEEALGLKFEHEKEKDREKGEHFFRSTLVQTLFYGLFSAWIYWHKEGLKGEFNWHEASWFQHVPVIRALFERLATRSQLEPLGITEVLDWAADALNRIDRIEFFKQFEVQHAVQYFYEPFLKAFDPELRKELGVWYTPPEIVHYMVERVDRVLRSELDIEDGLADDRVYVLDPCCGTGAYLVEVLDRIERTLKEKGEGDLLASRLKKAAKERVFGFEILPAPFVVSHLQLGLKLDSVGVPLGESERVGIYLTNSLTGWEPPEVPKQHLLFPEFEDERDAADNVKQKAKILVILGNPPYNAFAGVSEVEEMIPSTAPNSHPGEKESLVQAYKQRLIDVWGIKKFNLDDLYIRFFRIAERRIAEKTGRGILCFISNFSYLGAPSFVVMRERFLAEFDKLWFDCMNGDSRETGKRTPDGKPDPSIFSSKQTPVGIRVGTTIGLLTRKAKRDKKPKVHFRHFWGVRKKQDLVATLKEKDEKKFHKQYKEAHPNKSNLYSFRPWNVSEDFLSWPKLSVLSQIYPNGPIERRGCSLIVFETEKGTLELLEHYLDPNKTDEEIRTLAPKFMKSSGEFNAEKARKKLKGNVDFNPTKIRQYVFKPFDLRLAYLDSSIQPLFSRPSPELLNQAWIGNGFFVVRANAALGAQGAPFYFSSIVCDYSCLTGGARLLPLRIKPLPGKTKGKTGKLGLYDDEVNVKPIANLSTTAREYLKNLGISDPDNDSETAGLIWMHALAIGYSAAYLAENADGIRQDWPRIPLPNSKELLEQSAGLGRRIASLLDNEEEVKTVTSGSIRRELRVIGVPTHAEGKAINRDTGHLDISAGWGHQGKDGVTMPGQGKYEERQYNEEERQAIIEGAKVLGISKDEAFNRLGETTLDIYLNNEVFWCNLPKAVWEYYIGGYQVIKKWLSYREKKMLGRAITLEEMDEVKNIARRITAILLLEIILDDNYHKVKNNFYNTFLKH